VPAPSFYPSFYRVEHWGLLLPVAAFAKIFPLVFASFSVAARERERERERVRVWRLRAGWEGLVGGERGRECSRGIDGNFGSLFVFWLFVVKAERGTKCAVCLSFSSLSLSLSLSLSIYLLSVVLSSVCLPGTFGTVFAAVCFLQEKFSCHVQVILCLSLLQFRGSCLYHCCVEKAAAAMCS
jgi:hypothetical protein